jgi:hypothetical protein
MIAIIWFANLWLKRKNKTSTTKQTAMQMLIIGLTSLTTAIGIGYASLGPRLFIGDSRVTPDSWNYIFRWQPLSLVDSATHMSSGWSTLLYNQQELMGDSEGFSFLGLGMIALVSFLVVTIFVQYVNSALTTLHALILVCGLGAVLLIFTSRQVFSNILFSAAMVFIASQLLAHLFSNSHIHQRKKYTPLILAVAVLAFYSLTNRPIPAHIWCQDFHGDFPHPRKVHLAGLLPAGYCSAHPRKQAHCQTRGNFTFGCLPGGSIC